MKGIVRTLKKYLFAPKTKHLKDQISVERLEVRMERKMAYILRLLSINAFQKTCRKSLPAGKQISLKCSGLLIDKMICDWENDFYRMVTKEILNDGIHKLRFYIEIELLDQKEGIYPRGDLNITMHYFIHNSNNKIINI